MAERPWKFESSRPHQIVPSGCSVWIIREPREGFVRIRGSLLMAAIFIDASGDSRALGGVSGRVTPIVARAARLSIPRS